MLRTTSSLGVMSGGPRGTICRVWDQIKVSFMEHKMYYLYGLYDGHHFNICTVQMEKNPKI